MKPRVHLGKWALRLIVGGAFILAALLKIAGPEKFATDVSNYRLLPHGAINAVAIFLPWLELVAGLFVLTGVWLRAAALLIVSITLGFMVVIVSALTRGLNIECGCFGTLGGAYVGWVNLGIDAGLCSLAACLARQSPTEGPAHVDALADDLPDHPERAKCQSAGP